MTVIRKIFFKRLVYIGLGILPIFVFNNNKGPERFIALAGFLFGMFNFLRIITNLQQIVDDFFPLKTYEQKSATSFDKVIHYFSMTVFFCGLISEIFVITKIDNTIDGLRLFWISALTGLGLAVIITLLLKFYKPSVYNESNRRLSIIMGLYIGLFLLFPSLAFYVNETASKNDIMNEKYIVIMKGSSSTKNKEYYLYLDIKGDKQRVTVSKDFWLNVEEGKELLLNTKRGLLGYRYIIDFKSI